LLQAAGVIHCFFENGNSSILYSSNQKLPKFLEVETRRSR